VELACQQFFLNFQRNFLQQPYLAQVQTAQQSAKGRQQAEESQELHKLSDKHVQKADAFELCAAKATRWKTTRRSGGMK